MKKKNNIKKIQMGFIVAVIVCVVVGAVVFVMNHKKKGQEAITSGGNVQEVEDDMTITYDGTKYTYNRDLKNVVFLGVDKQNEVQVQQYPGRGGQSDAILVLSMNTETKQTKILQISRDSMVRLKIYDGNGNFLAEEQGQLALQYAYGDGAKRSCRLSKEAISELLYGIPISGYISLNMDGIVSIVDMLGGVAMTFTEDYSYIDPSYLQGANVVLDGVAAEHFVRYRNTEELGSNNLRMERQIAFLHAMMNGVKAKLKDQASFDALYNSASPYMVTDLTAEEMKKLSSYELEEPMYKVPGESVAGEEHDEYLIDEEGLQKLILELFYLPV